MNTITVPDAPERTRDLGVAEDNYERPPYSRLLELLRPLADEFGAGRLAYAARHLAAEDPTEQARIKANARLVLAGSSLLDELFPTTAATAA